jgi:ADP-ribose pyrophosphatase YjhB (NUDIX family)
VDPVVPTRTLLRWAESLAASARTGIGFTESLYERERYEEILRVAADIRATADEDPAALEDSSGLVQEWLSQVGRGIPGYVTPKVAVGAAVGNEKGELLLIQRSDSGVWLYPTGWSDVGYSAAEVVVKEVKEETGIDCEPVRLIAVLDGLRLGFSSVALYSLVFYCRASGGKIEPHPLECRDAGWFDVEHLPTPLAGFERWGDTVFAALRGEHRDVLYDRVREPLWRGNPETEA